MLPGPKTMDGIPRNENALPSVPYGTPLTVAVPTGRHGLRHNSRLFVGTQWRHDVSRVFDDGIQFGVLRLCPFDHSPEFIETALGGVAWHGPHVDGDAA